jgi:branched-chain amino acid transport system permease protein
VLVGGRGNIRGVALGVLIMGLIVNESTRFLPDLPGVGTFNTDHPQVLLAARGAIIGLVLVLFLRFRPQGLLPERRFVDRQPAQPATDVAPLTA